MRVVSETSKAGRTLRRGRGGLLSLGVRWLTALACAASVGACASISEKMSEKMATLPAVGEPAATPQRQVTPVVYPAVHDMPPPRATSLLNDAEQQRMEDELLSARDRQQAANPAAAAEVAAARKKAAAEAAAARAAAAAAANKPRIIPNASNGSIY